MAVARAVVDLLVGWTLDDELPAAIKTSITDTFARFSALWRH